MNIRLMEIASKPAGTYFIVTDKSQVSADIIVSKMRLCFINSERGPVNTIVLFQQGDVTGFNSVFGKSTRQIEKKGNLSINTSLKCLEGGPVAIMNLRKFDDALDKLSLKGLSANNKKTEDGIAPYTKLFNTNSLWTVMPKYIPDNLKQQHLINIANVGTSDFSVFCVVSSAANVAELTNEGDVSMKASQLVIDEYPAINFEMLVKDTFMDVHIFNNTFDPATVGTNKYYGHLFDADGNVDLSRLSELIDIPEAGYDRRITGSVIPNLKSESDVDISIDKLINQAYSETGLICFLNEEVLESDDKNTIDFDGSSFYDADGKFKPESSDNLLSHLAPKVIHKTNVEYPPFSNELYPIKDQQVVFETEVLSETEFVGVFEQGLKVGDKFRGIDGAIVEVTGIEIIEENVPARDPDAPAEKFVITIPTPVDGTITATVDGVPVVSGDKIEDGKTINLTNTPNANCRFVKYVISGTDLPVGVSSFVVYKENTIEVLFEKIVYPVHHNAPAGCTVDMFVTADNTPVLNDEKVLKGTAITVEVGGMVVGTEVKTIVCNGVNLSIQVNPVNSKQFVNGVVSEALDIIITLGEIVIPINPTITPADAGTVVVNDADGNPVTTVKVGDVVTIIPTPKAGYEILKVSVNGTELTPEPDPVPPIVKTVKKSIK